MAMEFYIKSAKLNNQYSLLALAEIYSGRSNAQIDYDLSAHYYFLHFTKFDPNSKTSFLNILKTQKIEWKPEYHLDWSKTESLDHQILIILLSSKYRVHSFLPYTKNALIKGICMKVIKFLCQYNQIIN